MTTADIAEMDVGALTKKYFEVWNRHDVPGIEALHAASSKLKVRRAPWAPRPLRCLARNSTFLSLLRRGLRCSRSALLASTWRLPFVRDRSLFHPDTSRPRRTGMPSTARRTLTWPRALAASGRWGMCTATQPAHARGLLPSSSSSPALAETQMHTALAVEGLLPIIHSGVCLSPCRLCRR